MPREAGIATDSAFGALRTPVRGTVRESTGTVVGEHADHGIGKRLRGVTMTPRLATSVAHISALKYFHAAARSIHRSNLRSQAWREPNSDKAPRFAARDTVNPSDDDVPLSAAPHYYAIVARAVVVPVVADVSIKRVVSRKA